MKARSSSQALVHCSSQSSPRARSIACARTFPRCRVSHRHASTPARRPRWCRRPSRRRIDEVIGKLAELSSGSCGAAAAESAGNAHLKSRAIAEQRGAAAGRNLPCLGRHRLRLDPAPRAFGSGRRSSKILQTDRVNRWSPHRRCRGRPAPRFAGLRIGEKSAANRKLLVRHRIGHQVAPRAAISSSSFALKKDAVGEHGALRRAGRVGPDRRWVAGRAAPGSRLPPAWSLRGGIWIGSERSPRQLRAPRKGAPR